jgi:hypothetical protein
MVEIASAMAGGLDRRRGDRLPAGGGWHDDEEVEMTERPDVTLMPGQEAEVRPLRARLSDARNAARRVLERLHLARVLIVALVQLVLAIGAWRVWVWRARRRSR